MRYITNYIIAGCVASCFILPIQAQDTPLVRWGSELGKAEVAATPTAEALKKMATEINLLKNRLVQLEENQSLHQASTKKQMTMMHDMITSLQTNCDRMQSEMAGTKTPTSVNQAGYTPIKKPVEDGFVNNKTENVPTDLFSKRLDELAAVQAENNKLIQQVQANTRELTELKKKHDALQLDFIQAQSDLGKMQQDMVKLNARLDGVRNSSESAPRQSLSLPTPPEAGSSIGSASKSALGSLRLVNNYPMTLTAIVDSQFYTLRPNDSLTLNRAPGYVTYEIVGVQGNTLRTINAAETLTVQIVPR